MNDDLKNKLFGEDEPFHGTRINPFQMSKYEQLCRYVDKIKTEKYPLVYITAEYKSEVPSTCRNASVFVNILAPANINYKDLRMIFAGMIMAADNFVVAVLEAGENKEHKIVRLGFGVRDVWLDEKGGS